MDPEAKHKKWLHEIQSVVNIRIITEDEKVPSYTSLWRHWLRTCWIVEMWRNSFLPDIYSSLPPPEQSGWRFSDGTYTIDWESSEVQQKIQRSIDFLLKDAVVKRGARLTFVDAERKTAFVVQDACA